MKLCSSPGVVDTRYIPEVPRRDALNRRGVGGASAKEHTGPHDLRVKKFRL